MHPLLLLAAIIQTAGTTIDPPPAPAATTRILGRETIEVEGKPACLYTVRYAGAIDQAVTWRGEDCTTAKGAVLVPAQLAEAGQLADLPAEARADIERMTGGIFVVEGQFSASAYPLNVAGRIVEVPYAD